MFSLPLDTWIRLIVWLAIGLVIYFSYGKKNSVLRKSTELEYFNKKDAKIIDI
jgi:APA family basic amino acid/polyamine antiporter